MPFTLPPLPYAFDALEPYVDKTTMEIHHGKHHAAYVTNLNKALESAPDLANKSVEELLAGNVRGGPGEHPHRGPQQRRRPRQSLDVLAGHGPERRRHAIGANWPKRLTASSAASTNSKRCSPNAALTRFGSGWAWLVKSGSAIDVISTANQDSPVMEGKFPVMGLDVWEHAYYLKYQNRRAGVHGRVVERRQLEGSREALPRRPQDKPVSGSAGREVRAASHLSIHWERASFRPRAARRGRAERPDALPSDSGLRPLRDPLRIKRARDCAIIPTLT